MTKQASSLAAKFNVAFLFLFGFALVLPQLVSWRELVDYFPVEKFIIIALGTAVILLAVYVAKNISLRATPLKIVMALLTAVSVCTLSLFLYIYPHIPHDQSSNLADLPYWIPQVICILLFIWLMTSPEGRVGAPPLRTRMLMLIPIVGIIFLFLLFPGILF